MTDDLDITQFTGDRKHVTRPAPPWRHSAAPLTQCGKTPGPGAPCWDILQFAGLIKRHGQQRMAIVTCITCYELAYRHPVDWDLNPVAVIAREAQRAQGAPGGFRGDRPDAVVFRDELLALAELVARHPGEFDAILTGLADAPRLADRRRARRQGAR